MQLRGGFAAGSRGQKHRAVEIDSRRGAIAALEGKRGAKLEHRHIVGCFFQCGIQNLRGLRGLTGIEGRVRPS